MEEQQKTVWITGASSGIGLAFARAYAARGYRLILTARRVKRLEALAQKLDTPCRILPADLASEEECHRICDQLQDETIDIFINNAGFGTCGSFAQTDLEKEVAMIKKKGVFDVVSGVLVGKPQDEEYYEEYKDILVKVVNDPDLPIVYNVNFGHATPRCVLQYGAMARVDMKQKKIKCEVM